MDAGINSALSDIISALTKPVTAEGKALQFKALKLPKIVYTGELKGVNCVFPPSLAKL